MSFDWLCEAWGSRYHAPQNRSQSQPVVGARVDIGGQFGFQQFAPEAPGKQKATSQLHVWWFFLELLMTAMTTINLIIDFDLNPAVH